jgi:rhamnulokinase
LFKETAVKYPPGRKARMKKSLQMLGIDLGAESGRAILGKFDGVHLSLEDLHRFKNDPVRLPDGLHWNILALWAEIKTGIREAVKTSEDQLASIGIDTWGVDFGLLDQDDSLIGLPFHYRDSRTDGMVERAFTVVPRVEIFEQTGIQFMQLNTLYQLFSMALTNSAALHSAVTFLTIPDLLNFWLSGRKVSEFSIATTTQCYDPRQKAWARPLLEKLQIPSYIFPEVISPGTTIAPLARWIAEECSGHSFPVIAPACHDTGSAVAAVPATQSDFAWISSGTWSIMGVESSCPIISEESLSYNLTNEGGVGNTFRLSKNIMGLWPVQECRRAWARQGKEFSYDELTKLAGVAQAHRAVVDIDHPDFLHPADMPSKIQNYCRQTGQWIPETPGEIVRLLLEGVAIKYREVLEMLESILSRRIPVIHIVGGGTKNQLLSQFAADATNRLVITGPVEATVIGNLMTQAIGLGEISSIKEARQIVSQSFEVRVYEPSSNTDTWKESFRRYQLLAR